MNAGESNRRRGFDKTRTADDGPDLITFGLDCAPPTATRYALADQGGALGRCRPVSAMHNTAVSVREACRRAPYLG
jgi:hypothetical protein